MWLTIRGVKGCVRILCKWIIWGIKRYLWSTSPFFWTCLCLWVFSFGQWTKICLWSYDCKITTTRWRYHTLKHKSCKFFPHLFLFIRGLPYTTYSKTCSLHGTLLNWGTQWKGGMLYLLRKCKYPTCRLTVRKIPPEKPRLINH